MAFFGTVHRGVAAGIRRGGRPHGRFRIAEGIPGTGRFGRAAFLARSPRRGLLDILPPNLEQVREGRGKASAEDASAMDSAAWIPAPNDDEAVLSLLLDWGLIDAAYELLMSDPNVLFRPDCRRTSGRLPKPIRAVRFVRPECFLPGKDSFLKETICFWFTRCPMGIWLPKRPRPRDSPRNCFTD